MLVDVRHPFFDSVLADDTTGGRLVGAHLMAHRHRRFGFLGKAQKSHLYVSPSQRRLGGYSAVLAEAGYPFTDNDIRLTGHGVESTRIAIKELLSVEDRPTAVFASDDILAAGALRAAHDLGLAVPSDAAVVGFDDGDLAEALNLTTVRQPLEESGRAAIDLSL